jgi:homocysteine S-methyltransferase
MAGFARMAIGAGAQIVGGCCGTTPNHIRAMRSALRALDGEPDGEPDEQTDEQPTVEVSSTEMPLISALISETPPTRLAERSLVGTLVEQGAFLTMVEIVPPNGIDCTKEIEGARLFARLGVNAIIVGDSPRASARMSAQSLCIQIQQRAGIETILHYTCRDRNILSIQSDLLGASSIGLRNIFCITGDPPRLGNYPDATVVFDVDSIGLVNLVRRLNLGLDIGGNSIGASAGFTIGVAANPGAPDMEQELKRFRYKVEAGAEYAITQPIFDLRLLENFLGHIKDFRIPVIAGIWPLASLRNAEFMKNDLRIAMPEWTMLRMAQCQTADAGHREGVLIAQEMLEAVRPMVQGVQVSAPFGRYDIAAEVLAGVLTKSA